MTINSTPSSQSKVDYWNALLIQFRDSGLTLQAFCDQQGISYHQLVYWRKKIQVQSRCDAVPQWVPVRLQPPSVSKEDASCAPVAPEASVFLHYGDARVEIPMHGDAGYVASLLRALA